MKSSNSPWVKRFNDINEHDLKEKLSNQPKAIKSIENMSHEKGEALLLDAFNSIYVANNQAVKIASRLLNRAKVHSEITYPSAKQFIVDCYSLSIPFTNEVPPLCITGLAGSGKSSLFKSIRRLMPVSSSVRLENHSNFVMDADWSISVKGDSTLHKLLMGLLDGEKSYLNKRTSIDELVTRARIKAHRYGISQLFIDELQFLSQSSAASTNIVKLLKTLCRIGIPTVYIANYSLGHKLKSRPQEDRQRLLSDSIVILPDLPDSQDWINTVEGYRKICPEIFNFTAEKDAKYIFGWTAGNKRQLKFLLLHAFRLARDNNKKVNMDVIKRAYQSTEFSINREDVEAMNNLWATGKASKKDLECPFELPVHEVQQLKIVRNEQMRAEVARIALESSMTVDERKTHQELQKAAFNKSRKPVKKDSIQRKTSVTVFDLKRNAELLKE